MTKNCFSVNEETFLELSIKKIPPNLQEKFLEVLKKEYSRRFKLFEDPWNLTARENQKIPQGNWFIWLILAGRGFGKTRAGAEAIKKLVISGKYKRIALIGETFDQIRNVMIEGESGLLNLHYDPDQKPNYAKSQKKIIWPNGAIATFYSAENPEQLRGPQFDLAWIDELAKFHKDKSLWAQLVLCLRLGNNPKIIITTTPKPKELIFDLVNRNDVHLTKGSSFENEKNLSPVFIKMIKRGYSNTKFENQEIFGELISKEESQLWNRENFIYQNLTSDLIKKMYVIIAIDPAMTAKENSNETGIIVASSLHDKFYILEDCSGKMNCNLWMKKASDLYHKYNAKKIIVETNQGGEILMTMLRSFEPLPWQSVRARKDKYARAMPVAALYEQKKVVHAKKFNLLEEQLLKAHLSFSDDRLDALSWALFDLTTHYPNNSYENFEFL